MINMSIMTTEKKVGMFCCCESTPVEIQEFIGNLGADASSVNHSSRSGGDAWYNWKGLFMIF